MRAVRVPGHFGELLQGRMGPGGPVALLTLPCPALAVTARIDGAGRRVAGVLPPPLARALLRELGLRIPGRVVLRAQMPVGGGAGSSTAGLVALARLAGFGGPPEALARACVAVEGASDPLMFEGAGRLLWASREGRVLGHLPPLRPCTVIGGFFGPPRRTDPGAEDFADIADLVAGWARARDLARQARLAQASAERRVAAGAMPGLALRLGALGWIAAHTGPARGLILPPGPPPEGWRQVLGAAGGRCLTRFRVG